MADRPVVVYLGAPDGAEGARRALAGRAEITVVPTEAAAVARALHDADALLDASMRVPITDAMVRAAPRLAIVSCATTGSDHIARAELDARRIPVRTLREDRELLQDLTPAAELTWALVLAGARGLTGAAAHTRDGGWTRELFPGMMLKGRRLGLIGCGRIGGWVARYGQAFGMETVGYDPHRDPFPPGVRPLPLGELIETADVVSVHVHLSDETRGLVSRELFRRVKPGAVFVNTSRGAVADEAGLLEALETGRLRAAGLDVLDGEPAVADHPLVRYARTHDNLVITPHCGGFSPDAVRLVCARAAEKIADVLKGTP